MKSGKQLSLQTRISIYNIVTFFFVLLLVGALYAVQKSNLDRIVNAQMASRARLVGRIWLEQTQKGSKGLAGRMDKDVASSIRHIAIFGADGRLMYSRNVPNAPAILGSPGRLKEIAKRPAYQTADISGQPFRILTTPFYGHERLAGFILLKYPMKKEAKINRFFLLSAPAAVLALFLPVFFLGRALVRHIQKSIEAVNIATNSIREGHLDAPIDIGPLEPELRPLAINFNAMGQRLRESFDTLRRFSSDASHELRTPLAVLKTNLEVSLRQERRADEYVETISNALDEINRLNRIVNGLLLLTRSESGENIFKNEPVEMDAIVREVSEFLAPMAEDKEIRLALSIDCKAHIRGDGEWLHRVVFNLLDNSIKYCRPNDTVNISLARDNGILRLEVADTGPGISPAHLPHVFERFWRAPGAGTGAGAGIGLALCRWVIEGHKGNINASSPPGNGATIVVSLPAGT